MNINSLEGWERIGGISGPRDIYSSTHYKKVLSDGTVSYRFVQCLDGQKVQTVHSTDLDALYQDEEKFIRFARKQAESMQQKAAEKEFRVNSKKTEFGAVLEMGWE